MKRTPLPPHLEKSLTQIEAYCELIRQELQKIRHEMFEPETYCHKHEWFNPRAPCPTCICERSKKEDR